MNTDEIDALIDRITFAQAASCQCMKITPDVKYHRLDCRYRVLNDAKTTIESLVKEISALSNKA